MILDPTASANTPTNRVQVGHPYPTSYLAYLVAADHHLQAAVPTVPLWIDPIDITPSMPREAAEYAAYADPLLRSVQGNFRGSIVEELRAAGVPARRLREPLQEDLEVLVVRRIREKQHLLYLFEILTERRAAVGSQLFKLGWEPVVAVCVALRVRKPGLTNNQVHEAAASLLNDGIPRDKREAYGVKRDHVRRAERNYLRAVGRAAGTAPEARNAYLDIQMRLLTLRYGPLMHIHAEAKSSKSFSGLCGAALADAINAQFSILRVFDLAAERLRSRGCLLTGELRERLPINTSFCRANRHRIVRHAAKVGGQSSVAR